MNQEIVWKQSHIDVLRHLYLKCYVGDCVIENESMLKNCFRGSEIAFGILAISELQQKSFVISIEEDGKMWISINKRFLPQIKKLIEYTCVRFIEAQPMENLIPEEYKRDPLFISEGDRHSKGIKGRYYYYTHKSRAHDVMCIIISGTSKQRRYFLGSVNNPKSIISEVYKVAKSKKKFYKADFNTAADLPHGIVENRQPIKAAIDVLEFFKLVRKTGKAKRGSDEYEINNDNLILTTICDFNDSLSVT
ncbi:MAG: hypothetical protein WAM14_02000 [Candidatus Nitrosopolaris sp.]